MQTKGEGRESLLTKFAQNFFQTNGVIFVGNLLGINDLKSFRLDLKFFLEWYLENKDLLLEISCTSSHRGLRTATASPCHREFLVLVPSLPMGLIFGGRDPLT